jgi:hypothetical protein
MDVQSISPPTHLSRLESQGVASRNRISITSHYTRLARDLHRYDRHGGPYVSLAGL